MKFADWESSVPTAIRNDHLWRMRVYRLALFASDMGWQDIVKITQDRRMLGLGDQLYRALGSVSANIAEGYGRSSSKDRVRFYEYSLGSARESRDWYYKARHTIPDQVMQHRIDVQGEIIRLLLTIIPGERGRAVHEPSALYITEEQDYLIQPDILTNDPVAEYNEYEIGIPVIEDNSANSF